MLKLSAFLFAVSISTVAYAEPAPVSDIVATTSDCLQLANKKGVSIASLEAAGWVRQGDETYVNSNRMSSISVPKDDDSISRICVVLTEPLAKPMRKELEKELSKLLKSKPMKQSDSLIWMVNYNGNRGIQLFDKSSDGSPATRLIAAQF